METAGPLGILAHRQGCADIPQFLVTRGCDCYTEPVLQSRAPSDGRSAAQHSIYWVPPLTEIVLATGEVVIAARSALGRPNWNTWPLKAAL